MPTLRHCSTGGTFLLVFTAREEHTSLSIHFDQIITIIGLRADKIRKSAV